MLHLQAVIGPSSFQLEIKDMKVGILDSFQSRPKPLGLKLVSAIFYQIFIFSPNDSALKTMKSFLYHLKSSFVLEILRYSDFCNFFPSF